MLQTLIKNIFEKLGLSRMQRDLHVWFLGKKNAQFDLPATLGLF